jgi:ribose transport system permease protein
MKKFTAPILNAVVLLLIPLLMLLVTRLAVPNRVSLNIVGALLIQAGVQSVLASGVFFQVIVGTMDLSIGAVYIFTAVFTGNLAVSMGTGMVALMLMCMTVGLLCGLMSSAVFSIFKIPSFIVTIAMMMIFECLSCIVNQGRGVSMPHELVILNNFPYIIICPVAVFVVTYFVYNKTKIGVQATAIGKNPQVAEMNGIRNLHIKIVCFMLMGVFTGFFSFMQLGRVGYIPGVQNLGTLSVAFDAMMCCFLAINAGVYLDKVICVFLSAFILQTTKYFLLMLGLDSIFQSIAVGIVVLILMGYTNSKEQIADWIHRKRILLSATGKTM